MIFIPREILSQLMSHNFFFLRHNQGKVTAREPDTFKPAIGYYFVFTLDDEKYVLDVKNDTVTAKEVSYNFDFVSCIALSGKKRRNIRKKDLTLI